MSISHPHVNVQVCATFTVKGKWIYHLCPLTYISHQPHHSTHNIHIIIHQIFFKFAKVTVGQWVSIWLPLFFLSFCISFLEQRLLALEAQYGKALQGLESEKHQLQELLERQSRLVNQLQGELGSSTLNSSLLQRQQSVLTDTVQQLLAMVNHCNGKATYIQQRFAFLWGYIFTNLLRINLLIWQMFLWFITSSILPPQKKKEKGLTHSINKHQIFR